MRFEIGQTPARSFDGPTIIHRLRRLRAVHCDCTMTASAEAVRLEGLQPVMNADEAIEFVVELLIAAAQADEIAAGQVEQFGDAEGHRFE